MMMKTISTLLLLFSACGALADGFSAMPLKDVLLDTDAIILVEILENKSTTTHREKSEGVSSEMFVYSNDIKARVLSTHVGAFTNTEYTTKYSLTLVKGLWLRIPGSGLEGRMAAGEKYVLMLKNADGAYALQRAEKADNIDEVLRLRNELDEEDRRVAEAQARIPNGIYHYSDAAEARKIRLQDGRRVRIGKECDFDIIKKELHARYNLILLSLTVGSGKPGRCVLLVDGKGYWLFDHHWAAQEQVPRTEQSSGLYCSFNNRENAEAVARFYGIAITDPKAQKTETPETK